MIIAEMNIMIRDAMHCVCTCRMEIRDGKYSEVIIDEINIMKYEKISK
jgi:hypothetical protein